MNKKQLNTKRPTAAQLAVLEYVARFICQNGYSPTFREIAVHFKWSGPASVIAHLVGLQQRGLIEREARTQRTLRLTPAGKALVESKP